MANENLYYVVGEPVNGGPQRRVNPGVDGRLIGTPGVIAVTNPIDVIVANYYPLDKTVGYTLPFGILMTLKSVTSFTTEPKIGIGTSLTGSEIRSYESITGVQVATDAWYYSLQDKLSILAPNTKVYVQVNTAAVATHYNLEFKFIGIVWPE